MATPDEKRLILPNQAVAWNPSITGAKAEDTYLIEGDAKKGWTRSVVTAASPEWPAVTITTAKGLTLTRPGILVR